MRPLTVVNVAYALAEVGPDAVGGAEQIVSALDRALVAAGHRSIVVAPSGSRVAGDHVATGPVPEQFDPGTRAEASRRQASVLARVLDAERVDLVHLHSVDLHEQLAACAGVPVLATLHLPISFYPPALFARRAGPVTFQLVSESQRRTAPPGLAAAPVIPNGVDLTLFRTRSRRRAFALALGRVCPEKRFDRALDAAARAGVPLVIGGRVFPFPDHLRHFHTEIAPRLGPHARFAGPLDLRRKRRLLSAARCLVVASDVAETSSLVALEALASGTPVVAWRAGALPEIVDHGRTGFVVDSQAELSEALLAAAELDGAACRRAAELRFCAARMTDSYLALYDALSGFPQLAHDYICSMDKRPGETAEPRSKDEPAKPAPKEHDSHGTPFERVPGPGPNDQGKGAAGREALDRIEHNH
ncbi:MAG TPA: glycosyltransferase [Polyangia bacterium]|nr:glycosyltransferase [Polyangia bacterium]